uniref:Uncharacterized protein n=1 Tax=Oryza brachyantha TaxID=4533 RepID=J3MYF5_ORYBR
MAAAPSDGLISMAGMGMTSRRRPYLSSEPDSLDGSTSITLYAKNDLIEREVIYMAKLTSVHSYINLLLVVYQTKVHKRGVQMSSVQRERIAIVRAIIKDMIVVLLDESVGHGVRELVMQQALDKVMRN